MAKAYWIAAYRSVPDSDAMDTFVGLAASAIEAAGGRFLARGGRIEAFEAGIPERTVLVEFDDFDSAVAAFHSDAYQEALKALGGEPDMRDCDTRIVEGLD